VHGDVDAQGVMETADKPRGPFTGWLAALDIVNFRRRLRRRRNIVENRKRWNAYRAANAARIRENARRWREKNREKSRLYFRAYRAQRRKESAGHSP
jgi:hypothetical protein